MEIGKSDGEHMREVVGIYNLTLGGFSKFEGI
jgi:hypothetical protein